MYYTVYKTTNCINGRFYVGKHQTNNPHDGYLGSGKYLLRAIKKYGKSNFEKTILGLFRTAREMDLAEKILVVIDREISYNFGPGGEGGPQFKGRKHKPETFRKAAETKARNGTAKPSFTPEGLERMRMATILRWAAWRKAQGTKEIRPKMSRQECGRLGGLKGRGRKMAEKAKQSIRDVWAAKKEAGLVKSQIPWNKGLKTGPKSKK